MGEGVTLVLVDHESMHASPRTIEADLNDDGMIAIYAHEEFGGVDRRTPDQIHAMSDDVLIFGGRLREGGDNYSKAPRLGGRAGSCSGEQITNKHPPPHPKPAPKSPLTA